LISSKRAAPSVIAQLDGCLCAGVDPLFGAPLSPAEVNLWESILLGAKRRRRTWREWLEQLQIKLFNPSGSPFGSTSGGAGGNAITPETAGGPPSTGLSFGDSYPWLYPTSDFQNFDKYGTVLLPATGTANAVYVGGTVSGATGAITLNAASNLPFYVPIGYNGFIKTLALDFVANGGAAWTQGVLPPALQFALQVNFQPVVDYGAFFFSPGTVIAPSPIAGVPIKEQNLVALILTNLTLANTTQYVEGRLQGYFYGKALEPKGLAF
jgi:hypothetical protein